jgi:DNA-directed RNA polymerase specialized sigma24 family protein
MARVSTLTRETLDRLLERLDPNRDRAGQEYEKLRTRLIRFFEWKQCPSPDQLTDETLDRLARRIQEGERIQKIAAFAWGVASNVLAEERKRPRDVHLDTTLPEPLVEDPRKTEADALDELAFSRRLEYQRQCLERLSPEDRALIIAYHQGRGRERIQRRRELAGDWGGVNALRIRAHRIRRWLVDCTRVLSIASAEPAS